VGHRVVHGGLKFTGPVLVTAEAREALEALVPLAPLHQPHNLRGIEAVSRHDPRLPQVACFDTAFHGTQPPVARAFALPRRYAPRRGVPLRLPRAVLRIHRRGPAQHRRPGGGRSDRRCSPRQRRQHVRPQGRAWRPP
jgi:hypothetical protein